MRSASSATSTCTITSTGSNGLTASACFGIVAAMPGAEIVNPFAVDEADAWMHQLVTTLLGNVNDTDYPQRVDWWKSKWIPERTWAVRDRGRIVGTLATEPRTVTIPGLRGGTHEI